MMTINMKNLVMKTLEIQPNIQTVKEPFLVHLVIKRN